MSENQRPPDDMAPTETAGPIDDGAPQRIGNYRILQKLGEGGMGEVFEAEQEKPVRRKVALKLIKWGMDTKQVVARFESERQALAIMDHPNIAKVFDGGATEQGRPYFAMEFVKGEPMTSYCDRHRLSTRERLELFMQVCDGVQHAHQKGIIHRDLKPSNVLVSIQGDKPVPKIIDFGIAKATEQRLTEKTVFTQQGVLIGTPEYMSPEQAEMTVLDIDTRTDVYSLGVMLYELITGVLPFDPKELRSSGFDEIRRKIREEEPSKPSARVSTLGDSAKKRKMELPALRRELKGDLDWITMRAMEKDRIRRYGSPNELAADVDRFLTDQPVLATPPSAAYKAKKFVRRHKVGVVAGAMVMLALFLGIAGTTLGLVRATRAEAEAKREAAAAAQVSGFLVDLFKVSDPSEARGNTITAREILDKGAESIENELAQQPLIQARMMHVMGSAFFSLSLYDRAAPLLEKALAIRREFLGGEHADTLTVMSLLGEAYRFTLRQDESRALKKEVLETRRRVFGDENPDTLSAMASLASAYIGAADAKKVEPLLLELLPTARRVLGNEHSTTLRAMSQLGLYYRNIDRYKEAEALYREQFETRKRIDGDDDLSTLGALGTLASLYVKEGRTEEAEPLVLELVEKRRSIFGPDHHSTMNALGLLAKLRLGQGRSDDAKQILLEKLQRCGSLGSQEPLCVAMTSGQLHRVFASEGNYEESARWSRKAIDSWPRRDQDSNLTIAVDRLARTLMKLGRDEEATKVDLEHLEYCRRTVGEEHPKTLNAKYNLARLIGSQGRYSEATVLLSEVLDVARRVLTEQDTLTQQSMQYLASGYAKQNRYDEAEALLLEVLEIRRQLYSEDDERTFGTFYDLGCVAALQGDRAGALEWLRQAAENGYSQADEMTEDPDLVSLHGDPEFEKIVASIKERAEQVGEPTRE